MTENKDLLDVAVRETDPGGGKKSPILGVHLAYSAFVYLTAYPSMACLKPSVSSRGDGGIANQAFVICAAV